MHSVLYVTPLSFRLPLLLVCLSPRSSGLSSRRCRQAKPCERALSAVSRPACRVQHVLYSDNFVVHCGQQYVRALWSHPTPCFSLVHTSCLHRALCGWRRAAGASAPRDAGVQLYQARTQHELLVANVAGHRRTVVSDRRPLRSGHQVGTYPSTNTTGCPMLWRSDLSCERNAFVAQHD